MLGVYSQAWNRRRQRKGHVFQARYKAVVVNGEESDGSYFKIVADYIHLNPVRSGWVGGETGKRLRSWSSFGVYAGNKRPEWLETARVMRAAGGPLVSDPRGKAKVKGGIWFSPSWGSAFPGGGAVPAAVRRRTGYRRGSCALGFHACPFVLRPSSFVLRPSSFVLSH